VDATHSLRSIAFASQLVVKSVQILVHSVTFDVIEAYTINAGTPTVGPYQSPGQAQDIAPIDAVIQGVKPKLRLLLGLLVQLLPQRSNFHRQPAVLGLRAPLQHPLRLFRSGMQIIQADCPSSQQKHVSGRATLLDGHYPASSLVRAPPTLDRSRPMVMVSHATVAFTPPSSGLPSFLMNLSTPAISSHPGTPNHCICSLLGDWQAGFRVSGPLATPIGVTRPNRVRFRYG